MPGPNAWMQIPTTILDLGQKQADAESWAAAQRATLAETWANVQRQAVQTMADTWQKGTDTLDHFTGGYQGAQDASTGPTAPPDYNDMAGASSSGPTSAFGSNPQDQTSPIDQARDQGTMPQLLGGDTPISGPINATGIPQAVSNFQQGNLQQQNYRMTPTLGTRADQPAREQVTPTDPSRFDMRAGFTPSQQAAQQSSAENLAMGSTGIEKVGAEAGVTRFFHGTGSSFGVPDATHFDPNGLFGPGYYLTSDARVAGSYAEKRATDYMPGWVQQARDTIDELKRMLRSPGTPAEDAAIQQNIDHQQKLIDSYTQSGPQTRAVNVPNNLNLLHADAPAPKGLEDTIANHLASFSDSMAETFSEAVPHNPTGADLYTALKRTGEGDLEWVNTQLQAVGFDGVRYDGGKRIPMTDSAGSPIEHTAINVFPDSMGKLTNAISGTRFGSPPAVGGAIVGGLAGAQQGDTPEERARNALLGAAAGGVGGHLLGSGQLGQLASDESGMIGRAPRTAAKPGEERAGNILLRKFDPGVQDVIAEAAAKDPAAMEAARRGVVSDATVQDLAQAAGTTVNKVIARWKPGDIANAETITAMKSALQSKAQEASDLAKTAVATPSAANDLNLALAVHEQNAIQAAVSGGTAELGRGLRALRASVQDAIQSGQPEQMQAVLKRMGGPEWTADLAKKLTQIDPTDAQARYDFLRNAMKPTLKNDLTFLWYNAMLSGPHTVAVKTMSELLSLASSPLERGAAAVADLPLSAMRGGGRQRFFGEVPADAVGMVGGIREGVSKALYTMKNGYSMSDVLNSDYIRPRTSFSPGVERVLGSPSRILAAGVDMMSSIAQAGAINAGAYRQASIEGLKGPALAERVAELRANPTKSLAQYAKDEGTYRVFQTRPVYGSLMQKIGDLRNADWHGVPVARIIVPFYQTPVNLMKQGLERSPMAAFNPAMWTQIIKKDPKAADSVGRWLLGSSVGAAIALEVGVGNITGPAPTNPTEADAWRRQGKIPWAFRVGDKYVAYNKIPYISQSIGQIASIVDSIQKGQDVGSAAGQLAFTMGANLIQEPYMQSLANFMNALNDPTRYAANFTNSMASSTVPALARVVAQGIDPVSRQTSTPLEAMQANIPGLSQSLPPRLDAFGQEQGRLTSNISPIGVSQATSDPVDEELTKYGVEPGFSGKTMRGIDLTREESAAHQRISGQLVKQMLTQLIADPRYRQANDLQKAYALKYVITRAKDAAATQYLNQMLQTQGKAALLQRIAAKKLQRLPKAG